MRPAQLTGAPAVVLVAHGSRDPRAAAATGALADAVAARCPGRAVRAAYLDHAGPRPVEALAALEAAGHRSAVLVPLLLTAAYHGRVDVPAVLPAARAAGVRLAVGVADVLGPVGGRVPPRLLDGLSRRLGEALSGPGGGTGRPGGCDAVVLAAAGTRDAAARSAVGRVAAALGRRWGVPATVAYASAAGPRPGEAVAALRAAGAARVAVAAYFLAPGVLYDAAVDAAREAGAVAAAAPLGDAAELADLVTARAAAVDPGAAAEDGAAAGRVAAEGGAAAGRAAAEGGAAVTGRRAVGAPVAACS